MHLAMFDLDFIKTIQSEHTVGMVYAFYVICVLVLITCIFVLLQATCQACYLCWNFNNDSEIVENSLENVSINRVNTHRSYGAIETLSPSRQIIGIINVGKIERNLLVNKITETTV